MRKKLTLMTAGIASMAITALGMVNISTPAVHNNLIDAQHMQEQSDLIPHLEKVNENYPLLMQRQMAVSSNSATQKPQDQVGKKMGSMVHAPVWNAPGAYVPTIYSNMLSSSFSGMVSYLPSGINQVDQLVALKDFAFNGGSGIVDGKLCGLYADLRFASYGMVTIAYYAIDMDTWQIVEQQMLSNKALVATETATDPVSGEIFGQFYTADLKGLEFGVIDYASKTRTTIAKCNRNYVALGIGKDGFAYGIDGDANLYKIDRANGNEQLVGPTGLSLRNSQGSVYFQSGEVDPKSGVFYWATTDKDGNSALFTVDLKTGKATKVVDFEHKSNQVSLVIPMPKEADEAPGRIQNLTAQFADASLNGVVKFSAPTHTFDGEHALTGKLAYRLWVNDVEKAKGEVEAGKDVAVDVAVGEGLNQFVVAVSNDKGQGPKQKITQYVGFDYPVAPSQVKLAVDAQHKATVSWKAPVAGTHGGHIGALNYNVYRIKGKDTVEVMSGTASTHFEEVLPGGTLKTYSYGVVAVNNTKRSAMAVSNTSVVGESLELPFFDDFNESIALYTVIDANNDKSTWSWDQDKKAAKYTFSYQNKANDWLISPPLQLEAGKTYKVSYKACASGGSYFPERIEAKWGKGKTIEAMTQELTPATELNDDNYQYFEKEISPDANGKYYVGFHAISNASRALLYLDSLRVEVKPMATAPDGATNLKAKSDQTGALKATIEFDAPTKTIDGGKLNAITKIEVKRGEELVSELHNIAPGAHQVLQDEKAQRGINNYAVIAYNASGVGEKATTTVFVGEDKPNRPKVKVVDQTTGVKVSWQQVQGVNGELIVPEKVRYDVFNVTPEGYQGDFIGSVTGEYAMEVGGLDNNKGNQRFKKWAVRAVNSGGESEYGLGAIVVGKPYTLPYRNSMKNGTLEDKFMGITRSNNRFVVGTVGLSYDDDGGSIAFSSHVAAECIVSLGKFNFAGAKAPKVMFYYLSPANAPFKFRVEVEHKDGTIETAWEQDFSSNSNTEWQRALVDLPASLATEPYAIIRFVAETSREMNHYFFLDNINIFDPREKDASVEVLKPVAVKKGQMAKLNVKVVNDGMADIASGKVIVSVDGEEVAQHEIGKVLKTKEIEEFGVDYRTTTLNNKNELEVEAKVIVDGDLYHENDVAKSTLNATAADVPTPKNLKAEAGTGNVVNLTWDTPELSSALVKDDFESYEGWGTNFGKWTTVDADHGLAGKLSSTQTYPHQGEEWAFLNWKPNGIVSGITAHSGSKTAVALFQVDKDGKFVDANNWLISPQLSGKAQTVSFWVNNMSGPGGGEEFEVLTSTSNTDIKNFTKIGDTHLQDNGSWTQINVAVPQGTHHFAIHHITKGNQAYIFMIDDAMFESSDAAYAYRIYRSGKPIANAETTHYDDLSCNDGSEIVYHVTAIYKDDVESLPVEAKVLMSGVENVYSHKAEGYTVYSIDGRLLLKKAKSVDSLLPGIYIINGKKAVISNR